MAVLTVSLGTCCCCCCCWRSEKPEGHRCVVWQHKSAGCNGWSPSSGDYSGKGSYCAKWGWWLPWCYVDANYTGYEKLYMHASVHNGSFFIACSQLEAREQQATNVKVTINKKALLQRASATEAETKQLEGLIADARVKLNRSDALQRAADMARKEAQNATAAVMKKKAAIAEKQKADDLSDLKKALKDKTELAHQARQVAKEREELASKADANAQKASKIAKSHKGLWKASALAEISSSKKVSQDTEAPDTPLPKEQSPPPNTSPSWQRLATSVHTKKVNNNKLTSHFAGDEGKSASLIESASSAIVDDDGNGAENSMEGETSSDHDYSADEQSAS